MEATISCPLKEGSPLSFSWPMPSTWVRPGSVPTALSIVQPSPAGSRSSCTSRMVVSPATIAGSLTLALPGTCGTGTWATMLINELSRCRADRVGIPRGLAAGALIADPVHVDLLPVGSQQKFRRVSGIERRLAGDDIGIVWRTDFHPVFGNADAFIGQFEAALDARRQRALVVRLGSGRGSRSRPT